MHSKTVEPRKCLRYIIPMGTKKRRVGRPSKNLTIFGKWVAKYELNRDALAERLKTSRSNLDRLCRGARRPSLELCVRIEKLSAGAVPVSSWVNVHRERETP